MVTVTDQGTPGRTVRDATMDVFREYGLDTIFSNPGSTEVPFLTDLPSDLEFVLGLHEGSVVGMATGWALANERPALVLLHTTAGLGNAVSALATARVNRAPLVVIVGQQDRRHLALEPFLAGRLEGLAGDYPVWVNHPARAQDVPGAVARASHEAAHGKGPAVVIVPMDDWSEPAGDPANHAAARRVLRGGDADPAAVAAVAELLRGARTPALVVGSGADSEPSWRALVDLAEKLRCPVFQECFGARAGFPQDHPQFAGFLPADRPRLRARLEPYDAVLSVGAPVFRQYPFTEGLLFPRDLRIAVVSEDPEEVHRSPAELGVHASIAAFVNALVTEVDPRPDRDLPGPRATEHPEAPGPTEPLRAAHVLSALAQRAAEDTVFVEETPSSRPDMHQLLPARRPMGFLSAAMGGLGFALPAATGVRMASPRRPVIAVVGDGSALYQVQALWSAARYQVGVLFIVLANGRYAVMDRLADHHGGKPAWPAFEDVSLSGLARSLGCATREISDHTTLLETLDEVLPSLADRSEPLLLDVAVTPDLTFQP
ncbi:thiamine pyrophosphate-binding protein [Spiractinospora alimapuensis]|uniref:thiamine pyrophosphate-dependent enzyme n=1 Tax=Spiractinospora alimapuensis TaxID=2820884 RepID=UPI001F26A482|nr:thiamine pyrophosphate-dependent enzyme [Spiractinospora alimapuensis]QVQ53558.1 thiamine pyrophosphate-binding protein [Spiractinospora alimapuensis]